MTDRAWEEKLLFASDLIDEIRHDLELRKQRSAMDDGRLRAGILLKVTRFKTHVTEMSRTLDAARLTEAERHRRRTVVADLTETGRELGDELADKGTKERGWSRRPAVEPPKPIVETEETRLLSSDQLVAQQRSMMDEQDEQIALLGDTVARQREIGIAIRDEATLHNQLLDDLHDATDRTTARVSSITRWTERLTQKEKKGALICVIILLVAVVVVLVSLKLTGHI